MAVPAARDATPILRDLVLRLDALGPADRAMALGILARPTGSAAFPGEHRYQAGAAVQSACDSSRPLCFHWDSNPAHQDAPPLTDTSPANGIPDAVDQTMATFAGVWDLEVGTYGFQQPLPDTTSSNNGGSGDTDVYLADLGEDAVPLFGYCTTDDPHFTNPFSTFQYWDASAYCVVDDDFADFGTSQTPQEFRDVTAAHEFFHAIQFHYDIAEDLWLMEGTAMMMEGQFRPDVKDRIRYLDDSTMTSPATPVDRGAGGFEYGAWIFWRFVIESLADPAVGPPAPTPLNPLAIRQIWERADDSSDEDGAGPDTVGPGDYSLQAVKSVLTARGLAFRDVFKHFAWVNRIPGSFYEEGTDYPAARPAAGFGLGPSRRSVGWHSYHIKHLAHRYIVFKPTPSAATGMRVRVWVDLPKPGTGSVANVLVRYVGGTYKLRPIALDSAGDGSVVFQLGRGTVKEADLILTNASTRFQCGVGTEYSCTGDGLDDGRVYAFRAAVL